MHAALPAVARGQDAPDAIAARITADLERHACFGDTFSGGPGDRPTPAGSPAGCYTTAFAVLGVHRWLHTIEDTLERVDARLVVPVLRAHQRTIELLVGLASKANEK